MIEKVTRRRVASRTAVSAVGCIVAVAALIGACSDRTPRQSSRPYNLLLITLDTTRADRLGCYGHAAARTPNLDRLAREGARFESACTPATLTLPSHATILTGTYPTFHKVHYNGTHSLAASAVTLAELCKQAGFTCGAAVAAYVLHSQFGLDQGFDEYSDRFLSSERRAAEVTDDAIRFLDRHAEERLFLWVHYYDPHYPRDPPKEFAKEFPDDLYDGEVAYTDSEIGRLLRELERRGMSDNTLIAVVADHGEGLLEHEPTHGIFVYEPTVRVPFLLHAPGKVPSRVVKSVVSTVDILPTLCELLELPRSPVVQGSSLTGVLNGREEAPRDLYLESYGPRQMYGWSELLGVRNGPWKYIRAPRSELYDVVRDPGEKENVIDREPETARALSASLDRLIESTSKGGAATGVDLSPADIKKLEQLGYVQGRSPTDDGAALIDPKDRVDVLYMHRDAAALVAKNPAAAIAAYQAILVKYPDEPGALTELGKVFFEAGRVDDAIACYERVVESRVDSVVALRYLAFLYFLKGRLAEAGEAIDNALRIQPDSNQSYMIQSLILSASGKTKEAMSAIDRSLAIDPHYDAALLQKGTLLATAGRLTEAIATLESVDPSSPNRYAALDAALKLYPEVRRTDAIPKVQAEMNTLKSQGKAGPRTITLVGGGY